MGLLPQTTDTPQQYSLDDIPDDTRCNITIRQIITSYVENYKTNFVLRYNIEKFFAINKENMILKIQILKPEYIDNHKFGQLLDYYKLKVVLDIFKNTVFFDDIIKDIVDSLNLNNVVKVGVSRKQTEQLSGNDIRDNIIPNIREFFRLYNNQFTKDMLSDFQSRFSKYY